MWTDLPCFLGGLRGQCWAEYCCSQPPVWIPLLGAEKPQDYHCIAQRDSTRLQSSVRFPCRCECPVRFCIALLPVVTGPNDWTMLDCTTRQFWSRSFESRLWRLINCHSNPVLYGFVLWSCDKAVAHPFEISHKSLMQLLSDRTSLSIILTEKLICIKWHACQQRKTNDKRETFYVYAIDIFIWNHTLKAPSTLKCIGAIKSPGEGCARNYWTRIGCLKLLLLWCPCPM